MYGDRNLGGGAGICSQMGDVGVVGGGADYLIESLVPKGHAGPLLSRMIIEISHGTKPT